MTSRLRGSAKEEPKSTSLLSSKSRTYLSSGREPRDKFHFEGSREKLLRKDSRGKYDRSIEKDDHQRHDINGYRSPTDYVVDDDEDPDLLYRRSRDHFGSWNIQDIITEKDKIPITEDSKVSKNERKSRFDIFKSNGSKSEKITNGHSKSKHKSPENQGFELSRGTLDRKNSRSRSPDRFELNKKNHDKTRTMSPPTKDYDRTINPPRYYDGEEEGYRPKRNRALLQEIENFGSNQRRLINTNDSPERIERRYSGNISPDRENDKIRLLIDRFKSNEQNNDIHETTGIKKSAQRINGSPSRDNDKYKVKIRSEDAFGSADKNLSKDKLYDRYSSPDRKTSNYRKSLDLDEDDERFGSINRKWKDNSADKYASESLDRKESRKNFADSEIQNYRSLERRKHNKAKNGDSEEGFARKRSDTYSLGNNPREKIRDQEDEVKESSSKRRSYVYSGSPDQFDVQIQRYERALNGPRKDPELIKKTEVKRRSSLKIKDEINDHQDKNGRHNRPLTPPGMDRNYDNKSGHRRTNFNTKDWYERNKQFSMKYLKDNSKVGLNSGDYDEDDDDDDDNVEVEFFKDEIRNGNPNRGETQEIYFGEERRNEPTLAFHQKQSSSSFKIEPLASGEEFNERNKNETKLNRKLIGNSINVDRTNTNTRNEPITIKIRNVIEDRSENEKRSKRNIFFNNDDINAKNGRRRYDDDDSPKRGNRDKDWTSATTPSRKIWNYRDGGAQITDVDEGQACLKCGDACSGFLQHPWRKNCTNCKCPREAHDVCHEEWVSVRSRLGLKGDGASGSVACDPREMGLAWAPPGLPSYKVEEYFSMLPEISVPRLGTPGERYRDRQLAMQLPKQDLAKAYCRHLAIEHYTSADDFMAARNEIALDIGTVQEILETGSNCAGCNESLKYGSLAVSAGKLGEHYHPACFQCVQCRELLVDLAYCVYNDAVYCERHYAERLKGRCAACDELIFSGEFTRAMNKDWHSGHFCCWQCDESLTGQRYVLRDEHPYCIKCYESVFANGCEECSKIIGIDSKDLSYKDKHWHEACFLCNKCRVSLVDKQFGSKVDKIYCGNCYDAQFASRCDGCGEIFRAGTKKMEYKTRQWHEKCFCCVVCKNAIGTKSFIPREQEIYCAGCYEDKFATRCVKCNKIITSGGVTYKNEPWHRECFTCSNCSTSLAGQRFTSRDEKPYCADCFGELFAKRCTACTKPITGIGGTRFISFEDRHWHNDCFICAGCKTSLVGRGFITDADDIICPECAKQKLM